MTEPLPFTVLAQRPCPPVEQLCLSLAAELWDDVDAGAAGARLELLCEQLIPVSAWPPLGICTALSRLTRRALGEPGASLRIDHVLAGEAAHPILRVATIAAASRAAGVEVGLASGGGRWFVAVRRDVRAILLDVGSDRPEPLGRTEVPIDLSMRCSHQLSAAILELVASQCFHRGDLARAVRAKELAGTIGEAVTVDRRLRAERN